MPSEKLYQLALTRIPNIGCVYAKILVDQFGSATDIFKAKEQTLSRVEGIGTVRAKSIKSYKAFEDFESELKFIEKYNIQMLFLNDTAYPKRLLQCYDSPTLLFYKGEADLNASRIISIIGTRQHTDYGKAFTEKLITDLAPENITVISGLAYGIDTIAHKTALKNNLATVGVLAHSLDTIYPPENKTLAKQMTREGGGLLTEFTSGTKPDKHNFPTRNRIVAGIADATIVIETDVRGGSMITAELAGNYNRDVFALPGKVTELKSRGCNRLISQNKAALLSGANELLEMMNWLPVPEKKKKIQRQLFIEMTTEEKVIFELLNANEQLAVDELYFKSGLSSSAAAGALLNLELQNIVQTLPGKIYRLI
jgi:DNA processing protein